MKDELKLGDHAAFFFKTNEERLATAVPYMLAGLKNNERCLYIADENSVFQILCALHAAGAPVSDLQKKGALTVLTKRESYLRHGMFEPEKMVSDLNSEVKHSLEHGFTGLRASGEMSWALDLPTAVARLIEYEEILQAHWPAEFGGLCQYDETRFSRTLIDKLIQLHSVVVREGQIIRKPLGHSLPAALARFPASCAPVAESLPADLPGARHPARRHRRKCRPGRKPASANDSLFH